MTRKDYIKFAAMFKAEHQWARPGPEAFTPPELLDDLIHLTADIFAQDNPRFDLDRFLTACGAKS